MFLASKFLEWLNHFRGGHTALFVILSRTALVKTHGRGSIVQPRLSELHVAGTRQKHSDN